MFLQLRKKAKKTKKTVNFLILCLHFILQTHILLIKKKAFCQVARIGGQKGEKIG